jgi:hypothetical protein
MGVCVREDATEREAVGVLAVGVLGSADASRGCSTALCLRAGAATATATAAGTGSGARVPAGSDSGAVADEPLSSAAAMDVTAVAGDDDAETSGVLTTSAGSDGSTARPRGC